MGNNAAKIISPTKTIGTKDLDKLWESYSKNKSSMDIKTAKKFLADLAKAIDTKYDNKSIDYWIEICDPQKTGTLDYQKFSGLFLTVSQHSNVSLTQSLATKGTGGVSSLLLPPSALDLPLESGNEDLLAWKSFLSLNLFTQPQSQDNSYGFGNSIPLEQMEVSFRILDLCAEITIEQIYKNTTNNPIEAKYAIPLPDSWGICGFEAFFPDTNKRVIGQVRTKEEAKNTYDDSIASGHGAMLATRNANKGTFKISVGNLPPNKTVKITVHIVTEVEFENLLAKKSVSLLGRIYKFSIPSTIFPTETSKTKINIVGQVKCVTGVDQIHVPNFKEDQVIGKLLGGDDGPVTFNWSNEDAMSNKLIPINIFIIPKKPFAPTALVEYNKKANTTTTMVTFHPKWDELDPDLIVPSSEIIFVVDRSGSMSGTPIRQVKESLTFFLGSLPETVKFNIIGFGDSFQKLFPASVPYNDANRDIAQKHVDGLDANLGGTELLKPLQAILNNSTYDEEYPRQLFILTDGEVSVREVVIALVEKHSTTTRVFTLGIGSSVDKQLVDGLAKAGKGEAEYVTSSSNESMSAIVMRQLQRALEPCMTEVKLEVDLEDSSKNDQVLQAPQRIRPIFNGERVVMYGILPEGQKIKGIKNGTSSTESSSTNLSSTDKFYTGLSIPGENALESEHINIAGRIPTGELSKIKVVAESIESEGKTIGTLAAWRAIRDLEEQADANKSKIIELSTKWNIISKFTAFIAVNESNEATEGTMNLVNVPTTVKAKPLAPPPSQAALTPSAPMGGYASMMDVDDDECNALSSDGEDLEDDEEEIEMKSEEEGDGGLLLEPLEFESRKSIQSSSMSVHMEEDKLDRKMKCKEKTEVKHKKKSSKMSFLKVEAKKNVKDKEKSKSDKQLKAKIPSIDDEKKSAPAPSFGQMQKLSSAPPPPISSSSFSSSMSSSIPKPSNSSAAPSSPAPSAAQKTVTKGDIPQLVKCQSAAGSWTLDQASGFSAISQSTIKTKLPSWIPKDADANVTIVVWSTLIVLSILGKQYGGKKAEWSLVAQKAQKWIKQRLAQWKVSNTFDEFMKEAEQVQ